MPAPNKRRKPNGTSDCSSPGVESPAEIVNFPLEPLNHLFLTRDDLAQPLVLGLNLAELAAEPARCTDRGAGLPLRDAGSVIGDQPHRA